MTEDEKFVMFRNRLVKVYRHLSRQARRMKVSCYRVYDHDLPEFPFCIEIYQDKLYVAEYLRRHSLDETAHEQWIENSLLVMEEVTGIKKDNIFLKLRQRKAGRLGQYQKLDEEKHEFEVEENGLKFIVNLSDYLDTGLFLDHRTTRQMVREISGGKKMLNLFAYTGSFSVYAAAGGATEVVTVDLSKTYLAWAGSNMAINGYSEESKYKFIHADVIAYLKNIPPGYFDLIVMDPPTFSNSKRMDGFLDIQRDHVTLINDALNGLCDGGVLYFSTNFSKFILDKEKIQSGEIRDLTKATTPFDFQGRLARYCYSIKRVS